MSALDPACGLRPSQDASVWKCLRVRERVAARASLSRKSGPRRLDISPPRTHSADSGCPSVIVFQGMKAVPARCIPKGSLTTDQKVGDSSSSGRAVDQGFCTDVKCPNRTKNCTVVKCREPLSREIQALHDFPASTPATHPPRTHHAPTDAVSEAPRSARRGRRRPASEGAPGKRRGRRQLKTEIHRLGADPGAEPWVLDHLVTRLPSPHADGGNGSWAHRDRQGVVARLGRHRADSRGLP